MSRAEKAVVLVYFALLLASAFPFLPRGWASLQLLWIPFSVVFVAILFRDLRMRHFPDPEAKVIWTFLMVLLCPLSVVVYLYRHGFRSRPQVAAPWRELARETDLRFDRIITITAITAIKVSLAAPFATYGLLLAFMGYEIEGLASLGSKGIGLCFLLGACSIGYPLAFGSARGFKKWVLAGLSILPLCLLLTALSDGELRRDPGHRLLLGAALLAIAMVMVDLYLCTAVRGIGQEMSDETTPRP